MTAASYHKVAEAVTIPLSERYGLIGMSVLDHGWMDVVAGQGGGRYLFLAEGLFMYLPPEGVRGLVVALAERFPGCELVFETVSSRWLKPWLRWMIEFKMQRQLGLGPGAVFRFGIRDAHEPEGWHPGIRLLEEWDWLDEDEPKLGWMRWMRGWGVFTRTQWTVRYGCGGELMAVMAGFPFRESLDAKLRSVDQVRR